MARLALPVDHLPLMFRFAVMTTKTVIERPRPKVRAFRMLGVPRFTVRRNMSARNNDGIAFDGLIVYHSRMTGRAALSTTANSECIHVFAMAHHETNILYRRR